MFKHANRGALPAMLVLGVLIGASLAVASPSRPNGALPAASPPALAGPGVSGGEGGAAGSGGAGERHECAEAITALAHDGDHGLSHAIARVMAKCKDNPQAPALVNALLHRSGSAVKGGGEDSHAGAPGGPGGPGGTGSSGSGGTGSGGPGSGGTDPGAGGSGGSGSGGSGSTGSGDKDNNGKAKGHFDGKGKNG
jgi:hypothetical protein